MVLREIAYLDVMADFECAEVVELPHDTFDERRFTFAVLANESHFLASADCKRHIMKDIVFPEIFPQIFDDEREVSATRSRRKTQIQTTRIF